MPTTWPPSSYVLSPYVLLVLTTLFWASNFVVGRAVREELSPVALSFWRWAVAALIILPLTITGLSRQTAIVLSHWRILLILSILGVVNFNTFIYLGLQTTTATNALITVSTAPVVIVALSWLLFKIPIRRRQIMGIGLSLSGVLVIICRGDLHVLQQLHFNRGDLWVISAVVSWALYSVCLKWRPTELSASHFLAVTVGAGAVMLLPLYLWDYALRPQLPHTPIVLTSIGYLALFPSLLAYIFWNQAVAELGANRSGQFLHLMPLFGTVLAVLFLGEQWQLFHVIGAGLIATGIYWATATSS